MDPLPIHFFTIVLNGDPFIRYHYERMLLLPCEWHWHVVEGVAELVEDTGWSLPLGGRVPADAGRGGRSVDGTAEYLDSVAATDPGRVSLYRQPEGAAWKGKREMVSAPLPNLPDECLLWQIDADELWTADQWIHLRELFLSNPERNAAKFYCRYFVGPGLEIDRGHPHLELEWLRAWRYRKGMVWLSHEPPCLAIAIGSQAGFVNVASQKPWWPVEMEAEGLVFEHQAYSTEKQVRFKENYYGYKGILDQWRRLQEGPFPARLRDYFNWPWVPGEAMVNRASAGKIQPIARLTDSGWEFAHPSPEQAPRRGVLYVVWGSNEAMLARSIASVRSIHPELPIHVQRIEDGATLLDKAKMADISPFESTLFLDCDTVLLDRLDFGFEMAERHGLACCICECPWARRYAGVAGDLVEYNTGVIFFTEKSRVIFDRWKGKVREIDSSIKFHRDGQLLTMPLNDQASFSLAVAAGLLPPFVLPLNFNFRPQWHRSWFGPIKVWHDYGEVPSIVRDWTDQQRVPDAIIQFAEFVRSNPGDAAIPK